MPPMDIPWPILPVLNVFLWVKYLGVIIKASTPDYLFNDFIVLGMTVYGSRQVTETIDFGGDLDDLDLHFIHIPIEDWVESIKCAWFRVHVYLEMEYVDLAYYVGNTMIRQGHGASVSWMYRSIHLIPNDSQIQVLVRTRPQPAVKPGHSIYRPPRSLDNPASESRIEPEAAREQTMEAEQKLKRRTRRGGKKYHERKLRKLDSMSVHGNSRCDDEGIPDV